MRHLFNLPQSTENTFVFCATAAAGNASTRQVTWKKPQNAKFIYFFVQGAGGGGGPGAAGSAGTQRGGGGAGGSGSVMRALVPAHLVPDILLIDVGSGGAGASGLNNGEQGADTYVSFPIRWGLTNEDIFGANGGGGGDRGTSSSGGSGGTGGAITNFSGWAVLANGNARAGQAGGSGHATSTASNITWGSSLFTPGAGGGGCVSGNAGGGEVGVNNEIYREIPLIDNNAVGATVGNPGFFQMQPLSGQGGSGGASQNNGAGAPGGHAGLVGSGGGGGGGGTSGGAGGNGGSGFVVIVCF